MRVTKLNLTESLREKNVLDSKPDILVLKALCDNRPMQYTSILRLKKITIFRRKIVMFHIFAQNIDFGYLFKPPR